MVVRLVVTTTDLLVPDDDLDTTGLGPRNTRENSRAFGNINGVSNTTFLTLLQDEYST